MITATRFIRAIRRVDGELRPRDLEPGTGLETLSEAGPAVVLVWPGGAPDSRGVRPPGARGQVILVLENSLELLDESTPLVQYQRTFFPGMGAPGYPGSANALASEAYWSQAIAYGRPPNAPDQWQPQPGGRGAIVAALRRFGAQRPHFEQPRGCPNYNAAGMVYGGDFVADDSAQLVVGHHGSPSLVRRTIPPRADITGAVPVQRLYLLAAFDSPERGAAAYVDRYYRLEDAILRMGPSNPRAAVEAAFARWVGPPRDHPSSGAAIGAALHGLEWSP